MPGQRPDSWSIRCARLHTAPPLRGRGKGGQSPLNPTPNPAEIRWSAFSRFSGLSPYPKGGGACAAPQGLSRSIIQPGSSFWRGGQHVRISMDEVRALDSETARLLHQRLCGWIDPGKTGKASIDTLCGYVWPSEASGSTMRKRRQRVREALPELVALGWTVTEFAAGKYDITRPKAAG